MSKTSEMMIPYHQESFAFRLPQYYFSPGVSIYIKGDLCELKTGLTGEQLLKAKEKGLHVFRALNKALAFSIKFQEPRKISLGKTYFTAYESKEKRI